MNRADRGPRQAQPRAQHPRRPMPPRAAHWCARRPLTPCGVRRRPSSSDAAYFVPRVCLCRFFHSRRLSCRQGVLPARPLRLARRLPPPLHRASRAWSPIAPPRSLRLRVAVPDRRKRCRETNAPRRRRSSCRHRRHCRRRGEERTGSRWVRCRRSSVATPCRRSGRRQMQRHPRPPAQAPIRRSAGHSRTCRWCCRDLRHRAGRPLETGAHGAAKCN
ncbi:hypothetical protein QFZ96_008732 [Paraburkholderia youngii]